MTQYESAIQPLAERVNGVDASLSTSLSDIFANRVAGAARAAPAHRQGPVGVVMTDLHHRDPIWKVDDLAQAPGSRLGISKSSVPRICKQTDGDVGFLLGP